jgi:serine protease AprX
MQQLHKGDDLIWMRPGIFVLLMLLSASYIYAQDNYYIRFRDKDNNKYTPGHPEAYLSARSIERRRAQHIAIREDDLPVTESYVDSIAVLGAHVVYRLKWDNAILVRSADTALTARLRLFPFVKSVAKISGQGPSDVLKKLDAPVKALKADQTDTGYYGAAANQNVMIQANKLHELGYRGDGVLIAVMDAGFINVPTNPYFAQLYAEGRVLYTWNYVFDTSYVYSYDEHGAYTFSCMAANIPNQMAGTAPNAQYLLFVTEDVRSEKIIEEYNWASAAEVADSIGADVFSTSLGYTTFDPVDSMYNTTYATLDGHSTPIAIAANKAANKGIIVVSSAGNDGQDAWRYIATPADADSGVAVGAVNAAGVIAPFSSIGPPFDSMVKPNICAQGSPAAVVLTDGTIGYDDGTSFSCPIAAGAFACLRQAFPTVPNMAIIAAVEQSCNRYTDPDSAYGYGIPNFGAAYTYLKGLYPAGPAAGSMAYPNPFDNMIDIKVPGTIGIPIAVDIYNVQGQKVWAATYAQPPVHNILELTLPYLAQGVYIVHVNDTYTIRMVKQP